MTALEVDPTNFNNQYAAIGEQRYPNGLINDSVGSDPEASPGGLRQWLIVIANSRLRS
jgi:hypothetical protein